MGVPFHDFCCLLWFLEECGGCGLLSKESQDPSRCGFWGSQVELVFRYWELTGGVSDKDGLEGGCQEGPQEGGKLGVPL